VLRSLLIAPAGAGKGTQGARLAAHYGVPHVATGDLLRDQVARHTATCEEAADFMARGELVPDRLVTTLVFERLAALEPPIGFVLDGFPRTITQAEEAYRWGAALDLTFHAVIELQVPEEVLVDRVVRRAAVAGRPDDTPDTVRLRLRIYAATSRPLLAFYRRRGILAEVDGTGTVDEVTDRIRAHLDELDLR
jgi:adenylate kinase